MTFDLSILLLFQKWEKCWMTSLFPNVDVPLQSDSDVWTKMPSSNILLCSAFFSQVAIYNLEVRKFNFYWLGFAIKEFQHIARCRTRGLSTAISCLLLIYWVLIYPIIWGCSSLNPRGCFSDYCCTAAPSASHHIWRGQPTHSCSIISFFRLDPQDLCASKSMK